MRWLNRPPLFFRASFSPRPWLRRWCIRAKLVLAIVGLGFSAHGAASTDTIIYPAGGVVGLDPPEGMVEAPNFAGFVSDEGASIVIVEMPPEAFDEIAAKFNAEGLASRMDVEGAPRRLTLRDGVEALLISGGQAAHGIDYRKWTLLARGPATTALVTVQIPDGDARYSEGDVLAALKSLHIRANGSIEAQIDALPFTIGDRADFRPVRTLAGSSLILTDGPADSYRDGSQPVVIIAASMGSDPRVGRIPEEDHEQLAFGLANQLWFADLAMEKVPGGEDGSLILVGTGTDGKHGQQVSVRQVLRFDETGYIRTVCIARPEQAIATRCDRVAQSVKLKNTDNNMARP